MCAALLPSKSTIINRNQSFMLFHKANDGLSTSLCLCQPNEGLNPPSSDKIVKLAIMDKMSEHSFVIIWLEMSHFSGISPLPVA